MLAIRRIALSKFSAVDTLIRRGTVDRRVDPQRLLAFSISVAISGCAMQGTVERQTVEYNTAAAQMANELALLNIVRAEEDIPIYYTSISRLTGSVQLTASGGFNAQIKAPSPVDTTSATTATANTQGNTITTVNGTTGSTMTATSPTGPTITTGSGTSSMVTTAPTSSLVTTVTDLASRAVTSGGNVYMPSIGGQIVTGPSFDINILDTQAFYQGVLQEVPFSTVETFINQDFDIRLLMRLLIERIEFRLKNSLKTAGTTLPAGSPYITLNNVVSDRVRIAPSLNAAMVKQLLDVDAKAEDQNYPSTDFLRFISCVALKGEKSNKPPKPLAPVSRITSETDAKDKKAALSLRDLVLLDGDKFDLGVKDLNKDSWDTKAYISGYPDDDVFILRLSADKRLPAFLKIHPIPLPPKLSGEASPGSPTEDDCNAAAYASASATFLGGDVSALEPSSAETGSGHYSGTYSFSSTDTPTTRIQTDMFIYFRSPEGVIRYLGRYLKAKKDRPEFTYMLDDKRPLFEVSEEKANHAALVSVEVARAYFSIKHDSPAPNMAVLALVEELIDLQKSGTDRPATIPVQVVP